MKNPPLLVTKIKIRVLITICPSVTSIPYKFLAKVLRKYRDLTSCWQRITIGDNRENLLADSVSRVATINGLTNTLLWTIESTKKGKTHGKSVLKHSQNCISTQFKWHGIWPGKQRSQMRKTTYYNGETSLPSLFLAVGWTSTVLACVSLLNNSLTILCTLFFIAPSSFYKRTKRCWMLLLNTTPRF